MDNMDNIHYPVDKNCQHWERSVLCDMSLIEHFQLFPVLQVDWQLFSGSWGVTVSEIYETEQNCEHWLNDETVGSEKYLTHIRAPEVPYFKPPKLLKLRNFSHCIGHWDGAQKQVGWAFQPLSFT